MPIPFPLPFPFPTRVAAIAASAICLLQSGCALMAPASGRQSGDDAPSALTRQVSKSATPVACEDWYRALDSAVDATGRGDAEAHRIDGYPQLRTDRFAAAFAGVLSAMEASTAASRHDLLDYLRERDLEARAIELANLPAATRTRLALPASAELQQLLSNCSMVLTRPLAADAGALRSLAGKLPVADNYAGWKRALGLYPLTSIPFLHGVEAWQRETTERFAAAAAGAAALPAAQRYQPSPMDLGVGAGAGAGVLAGYAGRHRNALGIVELSTFDRRQLLALYAPIIDVEARSDDDRFGGLRRAADGRIEVDSEPPQVYQRIAHTRFHGRTLTQLVYTLWFPRRPAKGAFDLLAGELDGLIIRLTLDPQGRPLLVDSIHACGCYHLFFPIPPLVPRPAPRKDMEWAFVPAALPAPAPGQRLQVRLAAASHYLIGMGWGDPSANSAARSYVLDEENTLRSLPTTDGARRSLYEQDGLVAGSGRGERFLFWPMGIASPGAMRQWGTHATAFVGRRHFDDADLLEQRFESSVPID